MGPLMYLETSQMHFKIIIIWFRIRMLLDGGNLSTLKCDKEEMGDNIYVTAL
jgi:hypothetical protein